MADKKRKADKKAGFGQGSGSTLVDAAIAADPIRNIPEMIKIELRKMLGKKDGGLAQAIEKVKAKEMQGGGEATKGKAVPPKFKGFSKLPESVQQKMNPDLAEKFGMGGDVKGKKGKNICRGRGIARKGTGFTIR
jgi:hypothetical protein